MNVTETITKMMIPNQLVSIEEASMLIEEGKTLTIAGSEKALRMLPKGKWIGGSIPYFMSEEGGICTDEKVFVSNLTKYSTESKISLYDKSSITTLPSDAYDNGFVYLIVPGLSEIHAEYSMQTHSMPDLMKTPIFGWISGVDLQDLSKISPKIINGETLEVSDQYAIALHNCLPEGMSARIDIINIFEQDPEADLITFENTGFDTQECLVNGKKTNLYDYITTKQLDTKLPLVSNYSGAQINISIQALEEETKTTKFYAPVQPGAEYRFAKPVENYIESFQSQVQTINNENIALSCNCILNYLYSELESKKIEGFYGPFTFGEIAYILVNQTLVYLSIDI